MSTARDRVLRDIRGALNRTGRLPDSVARTLDRRLAAPSSNLKPAIGTDHVERFVAKVKSVSGTVARVDALAEVPGAVVRHLELHRVPLQVVVSAEPELEGLRWSNRIQVAYRAAVGSDLASVTGAYAGVAETGSVVLRSSRASPTTLNFLPDDHLIVLRESRVLGHLEDVWAAMRAEALAMPRTINIITGPSKTGDIEQTIHEGAHGPRRFHVILIADGRV